MPSCLGLATITAVVTTIRHNSEGWTNKGMFVRRIASIHWTPPICVLLWRCDITGVVRQVIDVWTKGGNSKLSHALQNDVLGWNLFMSCVLRHTYSCSNNITGGCHQKWVSHTQAMCGLEPRPYAIIANVWTTRPQRWRTCCKSRYMLFLSVRQ